MTRRDVGFESRRGFVIYAATGSALPAPRAASSPTVTGLLETSDGRPVDVEIRWDRAGRRPSWPPRSLAPSRPRLLAWSSLPSLVCGCSVPWFHQSPGVSRPRLCGDVRKPSPCRHRACGPSIGSWRVTDSNTSSMHDDCQSVRTTGFILGSDPREASGGIARSRAKGVRKRRMVGSRWGSWCAGRVGERLVVVVISWFADRSGWVPLGS